jgi:hypothetical protein
MKPPLAIIGFGPSRVVAPWHDATVHIWGLNGGHMLPQAHVRPDGFRADAWFQIHPPEACNLAELDWMAQLEAGVLNVPTYVREADRAYWERTYPQAGARLLFRTFPMDVLRRKFPGAVGYANTFCLELALALLMGYTEVGLYGVECTGWGREVAVERVGLAYWIGVLHAHDVKLNLPTDTTLLYPEIYGLDYWAEARKAADITERVLPMDLMEDRENLSTIAAVNAAEESTHAGNN